MINRTQVNICIHTAEMIFFVPIVLKFPPFGFADYIDMTRRFGRRAAGGVLLINTDEEFFKNVIVKNGSYEVISKAIKYKFLVLDGEIVFSDDFKLVDPCVIRSVAIEFNKVYVSTDVGY